jgi:hypothetical protein
MITSDRPKGVPERVAPRELEHRKKKYTYWIWETKDGPWYWVALGNNGEAETQDAAFEAARNWIKFGE